jgi:hypothetical protein
MKVLTENYKGIEFVRISKLPEEQKVLIAKTLPSENIIKILKENELLVDCVQFKHYEQWFDLEFQKPASPEVKTEPAKSGSFKLALD